MTTIHSLCSVLSHLQGWTIIPNALHRPSVLLRETLPEDAPFLLSAAESSRFRSVNFPAGLEGLQRKIDVSQRSFGGELKNPAEQEYMFTVLSDHSEKAIPIGSSTFYPKHGTPSEPHNAYQIHDDETDPALSLITDTDGPAEVGAIVVHAALQGSENAGRHAAILVEGSRFMVTVTGGYGRAASWVRFFWAAMPHLRESFRHRECLAEMLPPLAAGPDSGRTNAFYETAVKPHFDSRTYEEMDLETLRDRTLIGRRLPRRIRLAELPEDARSVIGQVGAKSRPALKLLERLGFRNTGRIDPLDAGPHYVGSFSDNPLFLGARDLLFGGSSERGDEIGWTYGLMGVHRPERGVRFRAALGPFFVVEDDLFTTPEVAEGLGFRIGTRVTASAATL